MARKQLAFFITLLLVLQMALVLFALYRQFILKWSVDHLGTSLNLQGDAQIPEPNQQRFWKVDENIRNITSTLRVDIGGGRVPIVINRTFSSALTPASTFTLVTRNFADEFPYLQSYICQIAIAPPDLCHVSSGQRLILLALKSHSSRFDRRRLLRDTWVKDSTKPDVVVRHIFLLAQVEEKGIMDLVKLESNSFGDLIVWNFTETHHHLPLKERCFLEYLSHSCSAASMVFKGDDDIFVNLPNLLTYLQQNQDESKPMMYGYIHWNDPVLRFGKYSVNRTLYFCNHYPPFAAGGAFIMTISSVRRLYKASLIVPVFPLDDVYLGFLAFAGGVEMKHDDRFDVFGYFKKDVCSIQKVLAKHGLGPAEIKSLSSQIQSEKSCF
ncbi:N-acetyllactosaminide beta-1,3-N-acetylglucosaminyltransferase 2-like [Callorhinchus milii]|uniref:Hexosyltransferase n=2 Tax=Callorhinchus milii TaxID=7868 RepID=A0A4W3HB14_CALMI|nr:N-acetyllactosaminide beta-1,3-N-acetylglucosaminyltransferase 2-like isoform X2 [Callorhinchus milii]XP_007900391.1 N-acetyllactosaminide beta-1,3-N-acetylglucosaminyltransferase 2-like isoform X2 [Callorhinchus milii]XP_007900392.1 N-acetyllactosaminide beta-1,3-N-acetylglucosaminyltransferase 2-like isoform X2 [Callorhinchus milii]XP_007900394.1 N-acetyllactosaminide beta-1,3-N-acetylglucosaminyltransferase 2-like isoform X2 [Callorhinchus milii]XP_042193294.1 N-acetyllactosaminide beta-1|eukprot:gi/632968186/ref/XP_007900390.1/ PREDICTED: UDP-GlcNAc:betaGal beta-1,3-N-acetylglucosaminyltransferase 2-like isoform X2 [Callorhinchus milii]